MKANRPQWAEKLISAANKLAALNYTPEHVPGEYSTHTRVYDDIWRLLHREPDIHENAVIHLALSTPDRWSALMASVPAGWETDVQEFCAYATTFQQVAESIAIAAVPEWERPRRWELPDFLMAMPY